jgi:hypothetical protein
MRFTELREIVRNVRENLVCPRCQEHYNEKALDVVDIAGNKGVFAAQCLRCNTTSLITLSVREYKQRIAAREKQVRSLAQSKVSPNDVLDMKTLLNRFDGKFDQLFADSPSETAKEPHKEDAAG